MAKRRLKGQHRAPIDLKFHTIHDDVTESGQEVEVAFLRFIDTPLRVTLARREAEQLVVPFEGMSPIMAVTQGWNVKINGDWIEGQPLGLFDAYYAALVLMAHFLTEKAEVLTKGLAGKAIREGWGDPEVQVVKYLGAGHSDPPADQGGTEGTGPDAGAVRTAPWPNYEAGTTPEYVDGDAVGDGPEDSRPAVS